MSDKEQAKNSSPSSNSSQGSPIAPIIVTNHDEKTVPKILQPKIYPPQAQIAQYYAQQQAQQTHFRQNEIFDQYLTCVSCKKILYNPQTLKCGHSLCGICCEKAVLDFNLITCSVCKAQTPMFATIPNHTLKVVAEFSRKRKYSEREKEDEKEAKIRKDKLELLKYAKEHDFLVSCFPDQDSLYILNILKKLVSTKGVLPNSLDFIKNEFKPEDNPIYILKYIPVKNIAFKKTEEGHFLYKFIINAPNYTIIVPK